MGFPTLFLCALIPSFVLWFNWAKGISVVSSASLGVYLIHVHPLVFTHVIKDAFASFALKPLPVMLLFAILSAIAIFALCTLLDLLRIQLFKWIKVRKLCEMLERKSLHWYQKIFEK